MKALKFGLLLGVAILVLASCTSFKASGLSMTVTDAPKYTVLGNFSTSVWVNKFLGSSAGVNLGNITADATEGAVKDAINKEVLAKGGTAAVNVSITYQASIVNIILNGITSGLWAPATLIITGTVVK